MPPNNAINKIVFKRLAFFDKIPPIKYPNANAISVEAKTDAHTCSDVPKKGAISFAPSNSAAITQPPSKNEMKYNK